MNTLEALKAARELIADENNWGQNWYFLDANGQDKPNVMALHYEYTDPRVCRYCAEGAIMRVLNDPRLDTYNDPVFLALTPHAERIAASSEEWPGKGTNDDLPSNPIVFVNDHMGHDAVLE